MRILLQLIQDEKYKNIPPPTEKLENQNKLVSITYYTKQKSRSRLGVGLEHVNYLKPRSTLMKFRYLHLGFCVLFSNQFVCLCRKIFTIDKERFSPDNDFEN